MDTSTIALIAGVVGGVVVVGQTFVTHGIPALINLFKTDEGKVETKLVAEVSKASAALSAHRAKYGSIFKQAVGSVSAMKQSLPNPIVLPVSSGVGSVGTVVPVAPVVASQGMVATLVQDAGRVL